MSNLSHQIEARAIQGVVSFLLATIILLISIEAQSTVNFLVYTNDGIVNAADSRITLAEGPRSRIASDYYDKIIRVGKMAAVSCAGNAFLLDERGASKNISSVIEDYRVDNNIYDTTIISPRVIAEALKLCIGKIYNDNLMNALSGELDLFIYGYNVKRQREIFTLVFPKITGDSASGFKVSGILDSVSTNGAPGTKIYGQTDTWQRIIKGFDPKLERMKCYESSEIRHIDSGGLKEDTMSQAFDLGSLRYDIRYDMMSLQDAIDYAIFIVRATIEAQRFNQSAIMGVGGQIDIAIVTPNGFQWIQKKILHGEDKISE